MSTPATPARQLYQDTATRLAETTDTDILFYNSHILWNYNDSMVDLISNRRRRKNVLLILITNGGDPDAAYRMARCLQSHYSEFRVLVPGYCKSAGTLIVLGANIVIMSDTGEIGPLDMQMFKADELFEASSGLTVMEALNTLKQKSFSMFEDTLLSLKSKSSNLITFRTASEIAASLTAGLFGPIFDQIEPIKLGEVGRALKVAAEYGRRLDKRYENLAPGALENLLASYPSHSFVIDFIEAKGLFKRIRKPDGAEIELIQQINRTVTREQSSNPIVQFLSDELPGVISEESHERETSGTDSEGKAAGTGEAAGSAGAKAENTRSQGAAAGGD